MDICLDANEEICNTPGAIAQMLQEVADDPRRASIPCHCDHWYEQDRPCCHCGKDDPNLLVFEGGPE